MTRIQDCCRYVDKEIKPMTLEIGMHGEATLVVGEEHTAEAFGAGGVRVFGTPMMIGLMENAAWRLAQPQLGEGDTTVGVLVNVRHLAATPVGDTVTATAELVEIHRRRLVFRVSARDSRHVIGEGTHERAVVSLERFLARLAESTL
jgi:fluoroacetyl-CoA thioesterase